MKNRFTLVIEIIFLAFVFFMVNIRSFIFWDMGMFPEPGKFSAGFSREMLIWLMALLMMVYLLIKKKIIRDYLFAWLKLPTLAVFVAFSLASMLWSNIWMVTLQRSLAFTFASIAAVFFGARYSINNFLQILFWFGAVIILASLITALLVPGVGTDLSYNYNGAWRGIFWHKNQLGNIVPIFNLVFLFRFFELKINKAPTTKTLAAMLYLISFAEIFFANSASGYVLAILLHTLFLGGVVWLKTRQHLRPTHYYITLATITAVAVGIFSNLNFVLGLLNKNTTLTGRIPMWTILLGNIFIQHPWVGQGFDTIWADLNFRLRMGALVGWGYSPGQSDNGFIDILLNLGVVGFILFLLNYIKVWINSVHFLLQELSLESLFPIIFMVYSLFANLTWSMFMASEIFTWMVIIVFMVITIPKNRDTQPILYN